ncbi:MAG: sulfurtransferase-like selenium metabolism protein YedF [Anaerolineae bacterium]|nr:sulfurtransferase-like selenium metabolism protein YedF [Anaerolineae bacterium]
MMTKTVDARGLACPQPVILTRKAMQEGAGRITVIVDSETAVVNVTRMAQKAGWQVAQERQDNAVYLHLTAPAAAEQPQEAPAPAVSAPAGPTVLLVKSNRMGHGDDELGEILIRGFFHTLTEMEDVPEVFIFLNSGVKLTTEGSPVLDDLRALEERGVEIYSCGTCLNFFGLTEALKVGAVSNMYSIGETLLSAGKVISP